MNNNSRPWYHCNARKVPEPLDPEDKRLQRRLLLQLNSKLPKTNQRDDFFCLQNLMIQENEINQLLPLFRRLKKSRASHLTPRKTLTKSYLTAESNSELSEPLPNVSRITNNRLKALNKNLNKSEFLSLVIEQLNLLRADYNQKSKKHRATQKTLDKFFSAQTKILSDPEHHYCLVDESNMDEMRITYSMPREDQKILHELSLYACYGNELFETMTDTKSLGPP
jgi:hypothetical protein